MVQTASLLGAQALRWAFRSAAMQKAAYCVYGAMHYKDVNGSIARVGNCIPVLDFFLRGIRCRQSALMH